MRVTDYLDKEGITYQLTKHRAAFTAQQMASEEHVPGLKVAKPVLVKADKKFYMCVLPASYKVDLDKLKSQLGAKQLELADEKEMSKIFDDCDLGAEPPFGNLYKLDTIMDTSLTDDKEIIFQAGTHEKAIQMSMMDYKRLVKPKVLTFSYRLS